MLSLINYAGFNTEYFCFGKLPQGLHHNKGLSQKPNKTLLIIITIIIIIIIINNNNNNNKNRKESLLILQ